jgi:hypothetical protein
MSTPSVAMAHMKKPINMATGEPMEMVIMSTRS